MSSLHEIYFNSHDLNCKNPFGAVTPDTSIGFEIQTGALNQVTCYLNYYHEKAGEKQVRTLLMNRAGGSHTATLVPDATGLWFYWFSVSIQGHTTFFGNSHDALGGLAVPYEQEFRLRPFQITVHEYTRPAPDWYKNAIFYQIFPDRFFNGNDDGRISNPKPGSFLYANWYDSPCYVKNTKGEIERWEFSGGNLEGIRKKVGYLKGLGITGIYLNPIFEARSNHRYDTGDYHKIDPMLGTNEMFSELMEELNREGINVILDGVFNHTGDDSRYFNARGTYDTTGASQSLKSPYIDWYNFRQYPSSYECWWGVTDLPNVNESSPSYQHFIMNDENGVVPYWLRMGVRGWRLDVADELPDFFIRGIRQAMDRLDNSHELVLIGEVWEDASNKIAYSTRREYFLGHELHGVMNYPMKDSIIRYLNGQIRAEDIYRILMSLKENYPREAFYSNLNSLGTHDTRRIRTEFNSNVLLRLAVHLLLTLPGVPCIYYGDEAGLQGERDPHNRATFPWGREDQEILAMYQAAIRLRQSDPIFTHGEFYPFFQEPIFGYIRTDGTTHHLFACNPTSVQQEIHQEVPLLGIVHQTIPPYEFIHFISEAGSNRIDSSKS
ncbi:Amylopullulanase [anaerobic digester metagenome]